jgi:hypothetical protein
MKAHTTFFRAVARCLLLSVVAAFPGLTGGCGDTGQSKPDETTKAKDQEVDAKIKEIHAKKRLP